MTKIELKHISKTIHKNEVLHDISFMMESGKIYGFQGVNGSGKDDVDAYYHRIDSSHKWKC